MGFLKFILWCILIFYLLGWVGRLILRMWIKKKEREFAGQFNSEQQAKQQQSKHEGDITVERIEVKEKQVSGKVGEYVDYEEVK